MQSGATVRLPVMPPLSLTVFPGTPVHPVLRACLTLCRRSTSQKFFKYDLPNDVSVTLLLSTDEIRSRSNNKFVRKLSKAGEHTLAYRYRPSYDGKKFRKVSPKRLAAQAKRAKKWFKRYYNYDLKYVFFPYTKHHCTKQVKAVQDAGFQVFGHSLYVPKNFRRHGKGKLERQIKKLSKKKGSIVYHTAHNSRLGKDRDWVENKLENRKFNIVSLQECLEPSASESTSGEEDGNAKGENAQAENAEMANDTAAGETTDAGSSLKVSAITIAAVIGLMLVF